MEKEKLLQQIGLTELEAKTYLTLLQVQKSTAGKLAKKLNVQRSTIYYLLDNLQKRGFIAFSLKGKRKIFQACNPHIIEQQAKETYEKIQEIVPELTSKQLSEEKDEVILFTGYKGLRSAYEQMLFESNSGDEMLVLGARGGEDVSRKTYRSFFQNFNRKRIHKKINMRVIMNKELKLKIGKYYEKLSRTKVRYLHQHTLAPIVVFPTAIAIVQWKEEPSLFLLRGTLVKESFKQFFEALWKISKE
ncbi:MAG: helix-turn-helix domain-containing protein [Nanoarchaeota archaeon]